MLWAEEFNMHSLGFFMSSVPYSYYFVPGDYMCDLDPESQKLRSLLEDTLSGGSWSDVSSAAGSLAEENDFSDEFSDEYDYTDEETDDSSVCSSSEEESGDEKEPEVVKTRTCQPESTSSHSSEFELVDMTPTEPEVSSHNEAGCSQSQPLVASTSFCEGVELEQSDLQCT